MSKIYMTRLRDISQSAKEVITDTAGTNDDVSQNSILADDWQIIE